MRPIIIYYSRSGNTEKLAQRIKIDLGCKSIKVLPKEAYGNYLGSCVRAVKDKSRHVIPGFVNEIPDLREYEVILLGYPVWVQDVPAHLADFVRKCDLKGKIVIPFVTFGATGYSWTQKTLGRICSGATIKLPFEYGVTKKGDYVSWITSVRELIEN